MKEKGIEPKLRSFNPALQAHCEQKNLAEARPKRREHILHARRFLLALLGCVLRGGGGGGRFVLISLAFTGEHRA